MKRVIKVKNKMQKGYKYELVEPEGKNFYPEFKPDLSPKQMLALGVFGGVYMRDCIDEYPEDWFKNAKFAPEETNKHDPKINFFKVNASQPLKIWRAKGWINPQDPRGWFEWYCRYYLGRRSDDDTRQIKRWKAMRRHMAQIQNKCRVGDFSCNTKQRQAILHWAYDSRKI